MATDIKPRISGVSRKTSRKHGCSRGCQPKKALTPATVQWYLSRHQRCLGGVMKRSLVFRSIACSVVIVLTLTTINAYAEQPLRSAAKARHQAFLRGGDAITAALN